VSILNKKPAAIDSAEEHKISLPGLDIAFNHTLKIVFVVDQTGNNDSFVLSELEKWVDANGWFMHAIVVTHTPSSDRGETL
jgi:hypothetical protein